MIKILVLLAMFIAPILSEDPAPEIPIIEVTEEPAVEPTEIVQEIIEDPVFKIPTINGCTDKRALNYIPSDAGLKVVNDGSCEYLHACTNPRAANYVDLGGYTIDDGSCYYLICNEETGCDVSYTNPNKKAGKKSVHKSIADVIQPVEAAEEPIELSYIFDLDVNLFTGTVDYEQVCRQ